MTTNRTAFTARRSTGIVSHDRDGLVRRRMRFGWRQVVDADVRIYVQEVRAVHTTAGDGGMRAAVRLPGMRRACPPCPPDRTGLPHHVGRGAWGRRKVRAHHRRIARPGKIARSRMQLLRKPGFQDGETCQGESVAASLTDLASRDPANFPQAGPIFWLKSMAPVAARNAPAGTSAPVTNASTTDCHEGEEASSAAIKGHPSGRPACFQYQMN